jgi:hypothetical protein
MSDKILVTMLRKQIEELQAEIEHYRNAFNDEAKICADREQEIERLKGKNDERS